MTPPSLSQKNWGGFEFSQFGP